MFLTAGCMLKNCHAASCSLVLFAFFRSFSLTVNFSKLQDLLPCHDITTCILASPLTTLTEPLHGYFSVPKSNSLFLAPTPQLVPFAQELWPFDPVDVALRLPWLGDTAGSWLSSLSFNYFPAGSSMPPDPTYLESPLVLCGRIFSPHPLPCIS